MHSVVTYLNKSHCAFPPYSLESRKVTFYLLISSFACICHQEKQSSSHLTKSNNMYCLHTLLSILSKMLG